MYSGPDAARPEWEAFVIRVWMIRHGESESNAGLPSSNPRLTPLTALGHRQARHLADVFAEPPTLIVTSPFLRARQTAQPTISRFPGAERQEWPVQEFSYLGELHMRRMTTSERAPYAREYWERADPNHVSASGESFGGLISRARDFLDRLAEQRAGPIAVFTHGLFMRAVVWTLLAETTAPHLATIAPPQPATATAPHLATTAPPQPATATAPHLATTAPPQPATLTAPNMTRGAVPDSAQMRDFRAFVGAFVIPNGGVVELRRVRQDAASRTVLSGGSTLHLSAALAEPESLAAGAAGCGGTIRNEPLPAD
jgi:probable phosphoglycerate mutase